MRLDSRRAAALLLALLALSPGCESRPERHPKSVQTLVLSPSLPPTTLEISPISAVEVVLPGPDAGTGLVWEIVSNNNRVLEQMAPLSTSEGPGGTRQTRASFYALKVGRSTLRFFLLRPSSTEQVPAARCEVTVRVKD